MPFIGVGVAYLCVWPSEASEQNKLQSPRFFFINPLYLGLWWEIQTTAFMKNYYSILGVSRNASVQEIKQAFRKLAVKYHPDKSNDSSTASKFIEITEAYEVLRDLQKKQQYDVYYDKYFVSTTVLVAPLAQKQAWERYGETKAKEYASMSYDDFDRLVDEIKLVTSYTPNFLFVALCAGGGIMGIWVIDKIDAIIGLFMIVFYGVLCYFLYQRMKKDYIIEHQQKIIQKYNK